MINVDFFLDQEHDKEAREVYESWVASSNNMNDEQRNMFWNCLTLFQLARAFFVGCHESQFHYEGKDRLIYVGILASSFRQVYLRLGKDRLGLAENVQSHVANAQAMRELDAYWRWMQKKGIRLGKVYRYEYDESTHHTEWIETTPEQFVHMIFDAYRNGKLALLQKQAEAEAKKQEEQEKRRKH